MEAGVVPDHHLRGDRLWDGANALEQFLGGADTESANPVVVPEADFLEFSE